MKIAVRNSDGYVLNGFMIHCEIPHPGNYEDYTPLFAGEDYTEYEVANVPEFEVKEMIVTSFYYQHGILSVKYVPNKVLIGREIDRLKKQLSDTDYIIQKSYEYSLVGLKTEYDIAKVHADRQLIRDKINELETLLNQEGGVI